MARIAQTDWRAGEVSPNLHQEVGNPLYFSAASTIENMYISKTGVLRRLPAFDEAVSFGDTIAVDNLNYTPFYFQYQQQDYELLSWLQEGTQNNFLTIFNNGRFVKTISNVDGVVTDWEIAGSSLILIFDGGLSSPSVIDISQPVADWTIENFRFINEPTINFGDVDYAGFSFDISGNAVTISGTNAAGQTPVQVFTDTPQQNWREGAFYALGDNTSSFEGQAKITAIATDTGNSSNIVFTLAIIEDFTDGTYNGSRVVVQQAIFSGRQEWPAVVGFFSGRLYFANTPSRPMGIFGSNLNLINDFEVGKGLPAQAIVFIMNSENAQRITNILGHIGLFIFTDEDEHVVEQSITDGITPRSFINQRISDWGSLGNILIQGRQQTGARPVVWGSEVAFVDKSQRRIVSINVSGTESFNVREITLAMDITDDIIALGVNSSARYDTKMLTYADNTEAFYQITKIGEVYGRSSVTLGFFRTNVVGFLFREGAFGIFTFDTNNEVAFQLTSSQQATGLTNLGTDPSRLWAYNPAGNQYTQRTAGDPVPSGTFTGDLVQVEVRSLPLAYTERNIWDRREVKAIFVSYYNSNDFLVNGQPVALPTFDNIRNQFIDPKTDYAIIPVTPKETRQTFITLTSNTPWDITLQGWGYDITPSRIL